MNTQVSRPLKIALLSSIDGTGNYSNSRFLEEGAKRGHEIFAVNFLRCDITVCSKNSKIYYEGKSLHDVDVIIPRIGVAHAFFGGAVVRQFEAMKKYSLNGSLGISRSKDKLRSLQILARKGIALPVSSFSHASTSPKVLIDTVGGAPVIIKLIEGMQGIGVVLAETLKAAESVIDAFRGLKANMIVQEYIEEAAGKDIRLFVVGDKVVASMMREAAEGDFRSNIHRGGSSCQIKTTSQERQMAIRAARELKLNVAGVDIIRSKEGPLVLEVNSSPGLEGIEGTTNINVAGKIFEFIEQDFFSQEVKKKKRDDVI